MKEKDLFLLLDMIEVFQKQTGDELSMPIVRNLKDLHPDLKLSWLKPLQQVVKPYRRKYDIADIIYMFCTHLTLFYSKKVTVIRDDKTDFYYNRFLSIR